MTYFRSLNRPVSSRPAERGRFTHVALGVLAAALCIGPVSLTSAQPYPRRFATPARDYMAQAYPNGFAGPVVGNWRYGLSAHRPNDRAYPMTEGSGHATATGGPVGGIN